MPSERTTFLFTRLVEKLARCIADEGVLLFSAENPVTVAATCVSFTRKDSDDVGADFCRMVHSATNTTHLLSGASHRLVADLTTTDTLCVASFSTVDVSVASIDVGGLSMFSLAIILSFVLSPASVPKSTSPRGITIPGLSGTSSISIKSVTSIPSSTLLISLTLEIYHATIRIISRIPSRYNCCPVLHVRFSTSYSKSGKMDRNCRRAWSGAIGNFVEKAEQSCLQGLLGRVIRGFGAGLMV